MIARNLPSISFSLALSPDLSSQMTFLNSLTTWPTQGGPAHIDSKISPTLAAIADNFKWLQELTHNENGPVVNGIRAKMEASISPEIGKILEAAMSNRYEALQPIFEEFLASLGTLYLSHGQDGARKKLLPENLNGLTSDITLRDLRYFVENGGIPIYGIPNKETVLELLKAKTHNERKGIIENNKESIIYDCKTILDKVDHSSSGEPVTFAKDGLGALEAGFHRSAQAMLTVTLDTLISDFFPDKNDRKVITKNDSSTRLKIIEEMKPFDAIVWFPIWNAHTTFWKERGDAIPENYSRHASVHSVSDRQYTKYNCILVLMLVTSLISYAANQRSLDTHEG